MDFDVISVTFELTLTLTLFKECPLYVDMDDVSYYSVMAITLLQ